MFRQVLSRVSGPVSAAAASAAAAAPSTAQARSVSLNHAPGRHIPGNQQDILVFGPSRETGDFRGDLRNDGWCLIESTYELEEVRQTLEGIANIGARRSPGSSISDASEVESVGAEADDIIAAGGVLAAPLQSPDEFIISHEMAAMMTTLANDLRVQAAVMENFNANPAFHDLASQFRQHAAPTDIRIEEIIGEQAEGTGTDNPLKAMMEALVKGFEKIGHALQQAGNAVGSFFQSIGHKIGKMNQGRRNEDASEDSTTETEMDVFMKRMFWIAVVVLSVLVLKRKFNVRFV